MTIDSAGPSTHALWNRFVREHFPPIGVFMQTWEWGEFQKALGRSVERFFVSAQGVPVALFTLVRYALPGGLFYGYAPRGPLLTKTAARNPETIRAVLTAIRDWAEKDLRDLVFLRLEPPFETLPFNVQEIGFQNPRYYVQPRYNTAILIDKSEEDVLGGFHPSTRANIRRAEKRGVSVVSKNSIAEEDFRAFFTMVQDTIERTKGTNAYPREPYFRALLATIPPHGIPRDPERLTIGSWYGYHDGKPAAAHFAVFFGDTATYLYGASLSNHLSSKVTTRLHWEAMKQAQREGFRYYDLGGVDVSRWPSLSSYKRQFRGTEFQYIGNLDLPLRPALYRAYNALRRVRKS